MTDRNQQTQRPVVLRLDGITKRFGPLTANDGIDLTLRRGEILALLGENGAGKTTLMNILFGHYVADEGSVHIAAADGDLVSLEPGAPDVALAAGIGMVHQHFTLAENLTGLENITLGKEPIWRWRRGDATAQRSLVDLMNRSGLSIRLDVPVSRLTVGEKQRIEILKALYGDRRVLVMDEPTAVLTPQEADRLFSILRSLVADGLAVIFISHKLNEVLAVSDRIAVLRHGRKVAELPTGEADRRRIASLMVGRDVSFQRPARPETEISFALNSLLRFRKISVGDQARHALHDVDFDVNSHEIIGVAGISGNGQAALAGLIAGTLAPAGGTLEMFGEPLLIHTPRARAAHGVARIPEDRHRHGVVSTMTVAENLVLEDIRDSRFQRFGWLQRRAIHDHAARLIKDNDVRCPGPDSATRTLSGGNMQKVILARGLDRSPQIILADQPTRGLDVGAQTEVHRRLFEARDRGAGIVLISEDLDELLQLSDRIVVLYQGYLTDAGPVSSIDRSDLGLLMAGQGHEVSHGEGAA